MISQEDALISLIDIKAKKIKATQALLNKVDNLDNFYIKAIRDWLASNKVSNFTKNELDFSENKEFFEEYNEIKANMLFSEFEQQAELSIALQDKVQLIKNAIPHNTSMTLFGVDDRLPSEYEQKKWLVFVSIFNDPKKVIDSLNAGILTGLEIEALQLLYPSILEVMQQAIIEGLVDLKAKGITSLGMKKHKLINTILMIPRLSPDLFIKLQEQYSPEEDGKVNVEVQDVQTDTQRVQFNK